MQYGKAKRGNPANPDKVSHDLAKKMRKTVAAINGRVRANQNKIKKQYYHWRSVYRMFLDQRISTNVMALLIPKILGMMKDYPRLDEEDWFVLFFLYNTPFATSKEIRTTLMLRKPNEQVSMKLTYRLYAEGLIDRKSSSEFLAKRYFYLISLKGKALVDATCSKTLSKDILRYIQNKHDHLRFHKSIKKRAEMVKKWDWYDVPSATEFGRTPFFSKAKEAKKQTDGYKKWKAGLIAAGKWVEPGQRPPTTD